MGSPGAAISNVDQVIDQLDWLTAELEAQQPFLGRIPLVQLDARPIAGQPSLLDLYREMLERESTHLARFSIDASGSDGLEDAASLLGALIDARSQLIVHLRSLEEKAWRAQVEEDVTLLDWAYSVTLQDGETLRAVAERLQESQLTLGQSTKRGT